MALPITPNLLIDQDGVGVRSVTGRRTTRRLAMHAPGLLDLGGCALLLTITLPVMVLAGLAVFASSSGPVTTYSAVIDADGRTVFLHHFRTTYRYGRERSSLNGRTRGVTPVGWLLRLSGIARLPVLTDVWAGKIGLADALRS